jgi:cobalt-zinc-cadmium efflux system protein
MSGKKIFWVAFFNLLISSVELLGGLLSRSLALISDSFHNFSDTASIVITYYAYRLSQKEKSVKMSYGYRRSQILAAFINSSVLLVISFFLIMEAVKRFQNPAEIKGTLMISVAAIGLVANVISVILLEKGAQDNINIKSSYLHLISDAISSVGVLLGGLAIKLWHIYWIDPLVTVLIAVYIIKETWQLIKKSILILMQSSADLNYEMLKQDLEAIENIINVHHVHTWFGDEKTIYFEAHVVINDILISDAQPILEEIEQVLKTKYGIAHVTIQFESNQTGCCLDMFHVSKKEKQ